MEGNDRETHPSFGVARFNRARTMSKLDAGGEVNPGATMFDSDLRHTEIISFEVDAAYRRRGLNQDWIHGAETLMRLRMTSAQFGALVSSFGNGSGVPVTTPPVCR